MAKLRLSKQTVQSDILGPTIVCLVVNLTVVVAVVVLQRYLPPVVPLFYGQPKGEEQLARQNFLLLPPLMVTGITIFNTVSGLVIKNHFLQRVLVGFTVLTTLLSTITVIRIMLLVGSFKS